MSVRISIRHCYSFFQQKNVLRMVFIAEKQYKQIPGKSIEYRVLVKPV